MKKIMLLIAVLGLSACNPLEGSFKAQKNLTLMSKKLFTNNYRSVPVPAGNYSAKFDFTNFNNLQIDLSGISRTIRIKMPDGININPENDEFYIQGPSINQRYDFDGRIKSTYSRTNTRTVRETCTLTRYEQRCRTVCQPDGMGGQHCFPECFPTPVPYPGSKMVEYYTKTKNTQMRLKVLEPSTSVSVGLFQGNDVQTSRVITYESMCR